MEELEKKLKIYNEVTDMLWNDIKLNCSDRNLKLLSNNLEYLKVIDIKKTILKSLIESI